MSVYLTACASVHFVFNEGTYVAAKLPSYSKKGSQDGGAFSYLYGPQAGIFYHRVPIVEGMANFSVGVQEKDGSSSGGGGTTYAGYSLCLFQVMCPSIGYLFGGIGNSGPAFLLTINSDKFFGGLAPKPGGIAEKELLMQEQIDAEKRASDNDMKREEKQMEKYLP